MTAAALALSLGTAFAEVEYLYWTIDQSGVQADQQHSFSYAQLAVLTDDGAGGWKRVQGDYGDVYLGSAANPFGEDVQVADGTGKGLSGVGYATAAILEPWQGVSYAFQLELFNESWDSTYTGLVVSYEDLVYARFPEGYVGVHTWNAIGPAPIPEPTGGTLALLGLALLGLRRKRFGMSEAAT